MKKTLRIFLALALMVLTMAMLPATAKNSASVTAEAATAGWQQNAKGWWYLKADGTYPKNQWYKISGKWYHFDAYGYMQTGWLKLDGKWFYLRSNGAMATGWEKINGKWYLFNISNSGYAVGEMFHDGWWKVDGVKYWFTSSGAMATGWAKAPTKENTMAWFYFESNGKMKTGWLKDGGYWYYLDEAMIAGGVYTVDGTMYYFDSNGHMATGWRKGPTLGGGEGWFYFDANGAMHLGWLNDGGHWYYMDQAMVCATSGIQYYMVNGTKYYFNTKGYLVNQNGKEVSP